MNNYINLGNKKSCFETLKYIKGHLLVSFDLRIINSHITKLNNLIGKRIFRKDALYINSQTLWEIMQTHGKVGKHHYHELTEIDVYTALSNITTPYCVFKTKLDRHVIITNVLSHFQKNLL